MSYEFQDQILGMIISQHKRYWQEVKHQWDPEIFGDVERIQIAKKIKELSDTSEDVNMATISAALDGNSQGLVFTLTEKYIPEVNLDYFMTQLVGWHRLKSLVLSASDLCKRINFSKHSDCIDPMINEFKKIADNAEKCVVSTDKLPTMPEMISSTAERIEQRIKLRSEGKPRGASFGLEKMDYYVAGLIGGRFYITAARTSVGKTSFATWMALQAIKQSKKPLFFSNEMDREDLIEKFIAAEARISTQKFQSGDLTDEELTRFMNTSNNLAKFEMAIDEKSGWDLDELLSKAHRMHREGRCDIVFVDYLQQVRVKSAKSKYEQVSAVSDAMKRLSRDLNIPVVGLAQINREAEKGGREDIPTLSHLKDSGSLEQDADVVMILHKRDIAEPELTLRIAKNRYGQTGDIKLRHVHKFNYYEEMS